MWMLALALAHADCPGGSAATLPAPGTRLGPGAELVLQVTGTWREAYEGLASKDLALVSGTERIPLEITETLVGSFESIQWVLRPETDPRPGQRWVLEIRGEPLELYWDGALQPASWAATANPSPGPPRWSSAPRVATSERELLGCGPAVWVAVDVDAPDAAWVEATVRPADGGPSATQRLPIADGRVQVGHGMCSGPFELEMGADYVATLVAQDATGRETPAARPVRFTAP